MSFGPGATSKQPRHPLGRPKTPTRQSHDSGSIGSGGYPQTKQDPKTVIRLNRKGVAAASDHKVAAAPDPSRPILQLGGLQAFPPEFGGTPGGTPRGSGSGTPRCTPRLSLRELRPEGSNTPRTTGANTPRTTGANTPRSTAQGGASTPRGTSGGASTPRAKTRSTPCEAPTGGARTKQRIAASPRGAQQTRQQKDVLRQSGRPIFGLIGAKDWQSSSGNSDELSSPTPPTTPRQRAKASAQAAWEPVHAGDQNARAVSSEAPCYTDQDPLTDYGVGMMDPTYGMMADPSICELSSKRRPRSSENSFDRDIPVFKLEQLWARMCPSGRATVSFSDLISRASWLQQELPQVISKFEEIDRDGDMEVSFEDVVLFFNTERWLQAELQELVGLANVKEQIFRFHQSLLTDRQRCDERLQEPVRRGRHMLFRGNPGTGKSSVAQIIAKLLHRHGVISSPALRQVQRQDLVSERSGETALKTRKVIEEAKDGVLFIEEAYRLHQDRTDTVGREAVEELMRATNVSTGPLQIYAGYPEYIDRWMQERQGIGQGIVHIYDFQECSPLDLAHILTRSIKKKLLQLEPSLDGVAGVVQLGLVIGMHTAPQARQLMNANLCQCILIVAKQCMDARSDLSRPCTTFIEADIATACKRIPIPPQLEGPKTLQADGRPRSIPGEEGVQLGVPIASADMPAPVSDEVATSLPAGWRFLALRLHAGSCTDSHTLAFTDSVAKPTNPFIIVSLEGDAIDGLRQAWISGNLKEQKSHLEASWDECAVVPVRPQEQIMHVVIYDRMVPAGEAFVGSTHLALAAVPPNGFIVDLQLRNADGIAGVLRLELYWQMVVVEPPLETVFEQGAASVETCILDEKPSPFSEKALIEGADWRPDLLPQTDSTRKSSTAKAKVDSNNARKSLPRKARSARPSQARNCMLPGTRKH